jgi:hypothetical protein
MAVPVAIKAERHVTRALMDAGAIAPGSAQALDNLSFVRRRALGRLVSDGIVREAALGRYWLDLAAHEKWRAARLNRMLWVMMFMGVLLAILIVLGIIRK